MKIVCIETKEAQPQQTFDETTPALRVLVPAHLIGPIKESPTGCTIYLNGGFPPIQSSEPYNEILRKLNKINKE